MKAHEKISQLVNTPTRLNSTSEKTGKQGEAGSNTRTVTGLISYLADSRKEFVKAARQITDCGTDLINNVEDISKKEWAHLRKRTAEKLGHLEQLAVGAGRPMTDEELAAILKLSKWVEEDVHRQIEQNNQRVQSQLDSIQGHTVSNVQNAKKTYEASIPVIPPTRANAILEDIEDEYDEGRISHEVMINAQDAVIDGVRLWREEQVNSNAPITTHGSAAEPAKLPRSPRAT
jgi:hypothetical protein